MFRKLFFLMAMVVFLASGAYAAISGEAVLFSTEAGETVRTSDNSTDWSAVSDYTSDQWYDRSAGVWAGAVDPVHGNIPGGYQATGSYGTEIRITIPASSLTPGELYEVWLITSGKGSGYAPAAGGFDDGTELTVFPDATSQSTGLTSHSGWLLLEHPLGATTPDGNDEIKVLNGGYVSSDRAVHHGVAWRVARPAIVAPAKDATEVDPAAAVLEWGAWDDWPAGQTYEVTYRKIGEPNTVITTTDLSYAIPTTLELQTGYEWRVGVLGKAPTAFQSFTTAGIVSLVDPVDGTTGVEQDLVVLSWNEENVSGVSYKVNFGMTDPPANVVTTSDTSYTLPSLLSPNTTYYWSVDAVLGGQTAAGDVASFTTGGFAHGPFPANGNGGVATQGLVLTWKNDRVDSYVDSYDVYMGDSEGSLAFVANVTEPMYATDDMSDDATKFWKVVAKHDGVAIGAVEDVWSFMTGKLLYHNPMEVTSPNDTVSGLTTSVIHRPGGTNTDDPVSIEGIIGNAMSFKDNNDVALRVSHTPTDPNFWQTTGHGMTIACWVKWDIASNYPNPNRYGHVVGKYEGNPSWMLRMNKHYNSIQLYTNGHSMTAPSGYFAEGDKWRYHVATAGPAGRQYFLDGVLINDYSGEPAYNATQARVYIGARFNAGEAWKSDSLFNGSIDELSIYDRPLSEAQAAALYASQGDMAKMPSPAHGENDALFDGVLSWTPGVAAVKQKLYYGMMSDLSDATVVDLTTEGTYDIAGNLELATKYYWRVDSLDAGDAVIWTGDIWHFVTAPLVGDIVVNKIVDMDDLQAVAADWLTDTRSIPTGDIIVKWTEDFTLDDFTPRLGVYNNNWAELTTPEADPNHTPAVTQSVTWWMDADSSDYVGGVEYEANFAFPQAMDLTNYEKITLWVRPHNVLDNGYHRSPSWLYDWLGENYPSSDGAIPKTPEGDPIGWTEASAANDGAGKWVKLEWTWDDLADRIGLFTDIEVWFKQSTSQKAAQAAAGDMAFEFGEFVLTPKSGLTESVCHLGVAFSPADFNQDCDVDLYDFATFAANWLVDAN